MVSPIIIKTVNLPELHMSRSDWSEKAKHCLIRKLRKNASCLFQGNFLSHILCDKYSSIYYIAFLSNRASQRSLRFSLNVLTGLALQCSAQASTILLNQVIKSQSTLSQTLHSKNQFLFKSKKKYKYSLKTQY